ncbi:accessory gene regulator B family protein [Candidatus Contubernalis alkaliaceticus]|uniref:accessory gene regulator B family protein n=1 Tax=Candidatus Contubernalis alkaliaceticus TaxID=338645 RepID=UPI001F4C1D30|nr:accessory gene regulator B family protein [Candidatus Contubernalis alkalaceticus]UNC92582.1 accessory gene regulator B family protein [Candidatus Contubernalis alkalaceticus]
MKRLTGKITSSIFKELDFNSVEQDKINYAMEVVLTDLSKAAILLIFFAFFGLVIDFLFVLAYSVPLRFNVGGFHMNKYYSCLLFTLMYCSLTIMLQRMVLTDNGLLFSVAAVCCFLIYFISPVIPAKKLNAVLVRKLKMRGVTLSLLYLLIFPLSNSSYVRYGLWVIILQALLILIAKGVKENEKRKNKNYAAGSV